MLFFLHPVRSLLIALFFILIGADLLAHGVRPPHDWDLIEWGAGIIVVALLVAGSSFRWIVRGILEFFF
jgi:hypothetical protein